MTTKCSSHPLDFEEVSSRSLGHQELDIGDARWQRMQEGAHIATELRANLAHKNDRGGDVSPIMNIWRAPIIDC